MAPVPLTNRDGRVGEHSDVNILDGASLPDHIIDDDSSDEDDNDDDYDDGDGVVDYGAYQLLSLDSEVTEEDRVNAAMFIRVTDDDVTTSGEPKDEDEDEDGWSTDTESEQIQVAFSISFSCCFITRCEVFLILE